MAPVNLVWGNPWGLRTLTFHFFDGFLIEKSISMALTHHYLTFNPWENILSKFQSIFEWYTWIEISEKVRLAGKTNIDLSCFDTFGMRKSWRNTRAPWLPNSSRSKATRIIENLKGRVIWNIECLASSILKQNYQYTCFCTGHGTKPSLAQATLPCLTWDNMGHPYSLFIFLTKLI